MQNQGIMITLPLFSRDSGKKVEFSPIPPFLPQNLSSTRQYLERIVCKIKTRWEGAGLVRSRQREEYDCWAIRYKSLNRRRKWGEMQDRMIHFWYFNEIRKIHQLLANNMADQAEWWSFARQLHHLTLTLPQVGTSEMMAVTQRFKKYFYFDSLTYSLFILPIKYSCGRKYLQKIIRPRTVLLTIILNPILLYFNWGEYAYQVQLLLSGD